MLGIGLTFALSLVICFPIPYADSSRLIQERIERTDTSDEDEAKELIAWAAVNEPDIELLERLLSLEEDPVDLNRVRSSELLRIPLLTEREVAAILDLRKRLTRFSSLRDLRLLGDEGEGILRKIEPFVRAGPGASSSYVRLKVLRKYKSEVFPQDESEETSSFDVVGRARIAVNDHIGTGVVYRVLNQTSSGLRTASAYLELKDLGVLRQLIIGDFAIRCGKEALFSFVENGGWQGRFARGVVMPGYHVRTQLSMSGHPPLRGAVSLLAWQLRGVELRAQAMYSLQPLSVSENNSPSGQTNHKERTMGGRIEVVAPGEFSMGVSVLSHSAERSDLVSPTDTQEQRHSVNFWGFDARITLPSVTLFCALGRVGETMQFLLGGRIDGGKSFHSLLALSRATPSPFLLATGETSAIPSGETYGAMLSCHLVLSPRVRFSCLADVVRRGSISSRLPFHETRTSCSAQCEIDPTPWCQFRLRWGEQSSTELDNVVDPVGLIGRSMRKKVERDFKAYATMSAGTDFRLRSRVEVTSIRRHPGADNEWGVLLSEELVVHMLSCLSVTSSVTFFQTDSYESRLYLWEADLPGSISLPVLYDRGRRFSLYARMTIGTFGGFSLKYAWTESDHGIGRKQTDTAVGIQLDMRF